MNTEKYKDKRLLNKIFVCLLLVSVFALSLTVFAQNLIPCGKTVGITVTTKGVRVIDTAEFKDADGNTASPAADAGIVSGDILLSINGKDVVAVNDPYPPIKFRNVIYFPLTWRYAHDEFGWEYHFDNETGLSINSK